MVGDKERAEGTVGQEEKRKTASKRQEERGERRKTTKSWREGTAEEIVFENRL